MKSARFFFVAMAAATPGSYLHADNVASPHAVTTVSLSQARQLFDIGAVFVDVRDQHSWSTGHIDGAVNLDFESDEFSLLYASKALDRSTPLVFYTSSSLHGHGAMASQIASRWGYKNVYYFHDGYYAWIAEDFPAQLPLAGRLGRSDAEDWIVTR